MFASLSHGGHLLYQSIIFVYNISCLRLYLSIYLSYLSYLSIYLHLYYAYVLCISFIIHYILFYYFTHTYIVLKMDYPYIKYTRTNFNWAKKMIRRGYEDKEHTRHILYMYNYNEFKQKLNFVNISKQSIYVDTKPSCHECKIGNV